MQKWGFRVSEIKFENSVSYVNHESVPITFIQHLNGDIRRIADYLMMFGVPHGDQSTLSDTGDQYLIVPDSYHDVDEENPSEGDYYVIFPSKKVIIYTPTEFEANFKIV